MRKEMTVGKRLSTALVVGLMTLLVCQVASADEAKKYRDQIEQYSQRVTELRGIEQSSELSTELQQIEGWLDEALVQVGKEEFKSVKALLRRAEVQLDYVAATVGWKAEVARADAKEAELTAAKEDLRSLKLELDELQAKEQGLQKQVADKQGAKGK